MEDQKNEWKLIWDMEYLKVLASFANADGGTLTVGIDDNGKVVGINDAKELLKSLPDLIHNNLGIIPSIRHDIKDDKGMISITVNPSQDPVFYNGKAYMRSGSTTRELSGIELRSFIQRDGGVSWSYSPAQSINVSDIENYALDEFKKARTHSRLTDSEVDLPAKGLLEKLGLMSKDVPTRAAAILLYRTPTKVSQAARIRIGRLRNVELLFSDELDGPMYVLVDMTVDLIMSKYTVTPVTYDSIMRVENYPCHKDAIREAILNAVIN